HRITLEIVTEIGFAHNGLLASKLGKKVSTNLGAIQCHQVLAPSWHCRQNIGNLHLASIGGILYAY
ncbi:hypothetical protein ACFQ14_17045, partial [Pseudahrensia aquimaris]